MVWEAVKGVYLFITMVSCGYTFIGYMGSRAAEIPFPEKLYPAAAAAALCLAILVVSLVCDEIRYSRKHREQRRKNRCLGVIRYEDGRWVCQSYEATQPDVTEDEEG